MIAHAHAHAHANANANANIDACAKKNGTTAYAEALFDFVRANPRLFVLTGAGISAGSGIPTYRDHDARWQNRAPITHQEFVGSESSRRRYWARSMAGWPLMGRAHPNAAHRALASMQQADRIHGLVTQNVDGLHQRAGSSGVIELHGNVREVCCLGCNHRLARADVQAGLAMLNPDFADQGARIAPDGDADIEPPTEDFRVPPCPECGGMLKPDVVFFGANVPRSRVDDAFALLDNADAMLVVGSSLMVYSGFRFCERAAASGKPIASINQGRTRADELFVIKVEDDCTSVLPALAERIDDADLSPTATLRTLGCRPD